jgi:hypothetical protein
MEQKLDRLRDQALVVVILSTATLSVCACIFTVQLSS